VPHSNPSRRSAIQPWRAPQRRLSLLALLALVSSLAGAAETRPPVVAGTRQRISAAAGHGRSVQDIAATEQVSEGEVLLHLLLDKLKPEGANAEVC